LVSLLINHSDETASEMTDRRLLLFRRLHSDDLNQIEIKVMLLLEILKPDVDSGVQVI